jgi:hypothetical protein
MRPSVPREIRILLLRDGMAKGCAELFVAHVKLWEAVQLRRSQSTVTLHKEDFDAEVPAEWLDVGGGENHFTWAFRQLLYKTVEWGDERDISSSFEYVFDWAGKSERAEIEMVMAQFESVCRFSSCSWAQNHDLNEFQQMERQCYLGLTSGLQFRLVDSVYW